MMLKADTQKEIKIMEATLNLTVQEIAGAKVMVDRQIDKQIARWIDVQIAKWIDVQIDRQI